MQHAPARERAGACCAGAPSAPALITRCQADPEIRLAVQVARRLTLSVTRGVGGWLSAKRATALIYPRKLLSSKGAPVERRSNDIGRAACLSGGCSVTLGARIASSHGHFDQPAADWPLPNVPDDLLTRGENPTDI